jgi:hypothetical protein
MRVVAKSVEVVSWTDTRGNINPIRSKITNKDESNFVIKIHKIICVDKEKLAGYYYQYLIYKKSLKIRDGTYYTYITCSVFIYPVNNFIYIFNTQYTKITT